MLDIRTWQFIRTYESLKYFLKKKLNRIDEDVLQELAIYLWKDLEKFDRNKNVRFTTFLFSYVSKHLVHALRNVSGLPRRLFYELANMDNFENEEEFWKSFKEKYDLQDRTIRKYQNNLKAMKTVSLDEKEADKEYLAKSDFDEKFLLQKVIFENELEKLSDVDKEIIRRVMNGELLINIAKELGLSRETVRIRLLKSLEKIKRSVRKIWNISSL